jgi:hypothetical protein
MWLVWNVECEKRYHVASVECRVRQLVSHEMATVECSVISGIRWLIWCVECATSDIRWPLWSVECDRWYQVALMKCRVRQVVSGCLCGV